MISTQTPTKVESTQYFSAPSILAASLHEPDFDPCGASGQLKLVSFLIGVELTDSELMPALEFCKPELDFYMLDYSQWTECVKETMDSIRELRDSDDKEKRVKEANQLAILQHRIRSNSAQKGKDIAPIFHGPMKWEQYKNGVVNRTG